MEGSSENLNSSAVVDRSSRFRDCSSRKDISLRQWLDNSERTVDALECLHIFAQIVVIVNLAHSQGIVVHNVRPSCFVMSSFNRVAFIESASCSDSGSASSCEDGLNSVPCDSVIVSESSCLQSGSVQNSEANKNGQIEENKQNFPMKRILHLETIWYTSPEEVVDGGSSTCASDIYRLGVLLFELFCTFNSSDEKIATMSCLRHRVLPPQLLLKWPKEASFCLWLLHPVPSSRPKMGELLESEFLKTPRHDLEEREAAIELKEKIDEQELLLEFLLLLQQRKQEARDNLNEIVSFLSSDIEEVSKRQTNLKIKAGLNLNVTEDDGSGSSGSRKRLKPSTDEEKNEYDGSFLSKNSRVMKNFKKLEAAYFTTRRRVMKSTEKSSSRFCRTSADSRSNGTATDRSSLSNLSSKRGSNKDRQPSGWINSYLEGLCKYFAYNKLEVKADLKQGDLLNSSNLVCSIGFDRDGEFFATAGVNKKIKVFEYNSVVNANRDIHYPVVEMANRSKLSSICWNGYIKSQLASSNFEGVVQVWDVTRSQIFTEMREHEKRVWSIDFSLADPTMLASGSDDGSVKLWNINQGVSVRTIKTSANVCCVQFPSDSGQCIAFGSADHKIYFYDLRNSRVALRTLIGHQKTVSYVKFIDSKTLVSASTDNTIKLWDLSTCSSGVIDSPLQSFTGHTNLKNFVGLSVSDGYIATGSETNEVVVYHKAFPMPALSYKFQTTDPLSGDEVDDGAQFISSVCWRGQSPTLVAANSMGNIRVLEMV